MKNILRITLPTLLLLAGLLGAIYFSWGASNKGEFIIKASNHEISAKYTQYTCFTVPVVAPGEKIYITGFELMIDENAPASAFVHHYVLSIADPEVKPGTETCYDWPGNPIWAGGSHNDSIVFPEDVSIALGGEQETRLTLQIHYHNPSRTAGMIDNTSGIKIHYQKTPRPIEGGMLTVGSIYDIKVPPGETVDFAALRCTEEDTKKIGPITVFASGLHAHELGRTLWMNQYRNGELIGEINRNDFFEFTTQNFDIGNWKIEPGDELEMHCLYTNPTDKPAKGGRASTDEMCLNFMLYYPKSPYNFCGGVITDPKTTGLQ